MVVLLSPGVKMRVGPGRLYVPLTELLNSQGFRVLRFDFFGLGDSEGDLDETVLADVYNNIEVGRYVDDTLAALNWLSAEHGAKRFVLGGLCGGAITAILAAERDARVDSLLSIGMTVTLASNAAKPGQYLTRAQLDDRRRRYLLKMLKPEAWLRFLTFRSEYDVIWKVDETRVHQGQAGGGRAGGARRHRSADRTTRQRESAVPQGLLHVPRARRQGAHALQRARPAAIRIRGEVCAAVSPRSSRRMPRRSSST